MRQTIGWFARTVALPLFPVLVGVVIRYIHTGTASEHLLDGGELAFSMAIVSLLILSQADRLNDRDLRDSLSIVYLLATLIFLSIFASALVATIKLHADTTHVFDQLRQLKAGSVLPDTLVRGLNDPVKGNEILSTIRSIAIGFAVVTILLTVVIRSRYELRD